ncbi:hypothetical protein GCM10010193_12240 [Kitasatospora atroaurantiaca]|uniref:Helix-turn-helix protein n=1 Tax=Kitasatospora atroaurantiaca TaxID=285545 RepID=A0A561EQP7_9ACTN|nr:hypothetical protein [Kitasatospora atroaurantiaca]TWE17914.1 hypothetical protein FB465_2958 [Kitasatospora atroaurantiaca]
MADAGIPHRLPRALLADPEMIAACRARKFSTVFRLLKQAGIYPSMIARACDLTPSRVGEVIAGNRNIEKIDLVERIADGLHIPGHMLGLATRGWEQSARPATATNAITHALPKPTYSAAVPSPLIEPEFFASQIRAIMPSHYKAANLFGSRHALDPVERHVRSIDRLQEHTAGPVRDDLLTLGARIAEFLGWLHQDLGDFTQATYWSDRAMEWSQETGDDLMTSYVLFRKSNQATARRNPQQAVSLARAAQRVSGVTPRIRALAAQQEAQGHALMGNPKFAQTKFDEAYELATAPDEPEDDDALDTAYCTPTYVEMQRANCWIELGDPQRAARVFEAELAVLPQVYRNDQGVYLSRLARAYATAGEPEQGAAAADRALSIALDTESARAIGELAAAGQSLLKWRDVPAVAAFSDRLTLARSAVVPRPRTS